MTVPPFFVERGERCRERFAVMKVLNGSISRELCALSITGYVAIMNSSHESVWLRAWEYDGNVSLINPYLLRSFEHPKITLD